MNMDSMAAVRAVTTEKRKDTPIYNDDNGISSTSPEPNAKRRQIRKGTRSCWDCKRRKVRCTFASDEDTICIPCRRRGAACVSQDQPEEESFAGDPHGQLVDRVQRVESLLGELLKKGDDIERAVQLAGLGLSGHRKSGMTTPPSGPHSVISHHSSKDSRLQPQERITAELPFPTPESFAVSPNITLPEGDSYRTLTQNLLEAFPSQHDIDTLCKSNYTATYYVHQIFARAEIGPEHEVIDVVNELAKIPDPSTHPVLVAKRMFLLALLTQFFGPQNVSDQAAIFMKTLADAAIRLVTTNDQMVGCWEGLECIIFEGVYQSNGGNLRRAWLAFRRAMVMAQMMRMDRPNPPSINKLDPKARVNPKSMWFRIVSMDSYLSLMLGLPHGNQDMLRDADVLGETQSGRLERAHALIAGRILERNKNNISLQDHIAVTHELDRELLTVAKSLPDKFWLPPNFNNLLPNTREGFTEQLRLTEQLHHYNLVHLLHLPFLLRGDDNACFVYFKNACVTASREILTRYNAFRSFNRNSCCCRTPDFFALMAGMSILLAHIESHRCDTGSFYAHQRLGDRAMVEEVIESMDELVRQTGDSLAGKSIDLLRCLLVIESEAAQGKDHLAQTTMSYLEEHCADGIQLPIPYFGIIKIGRGGITTKDWPTSQNSLRQPTDGMPSVVHDANRIFQTPAPADLAPLPSQQPMQYTMAAADDTVLQQQAFYPSLAAEVNDWAFQGVDAAFFDSLMLPTNM